jgi:putative endonuclease
MYYVYMLKCSDNTFYIGQTNNIVRRMVQHRDGRHGARYTKSRRPLQLVYVETHRSRSYVVRRERELKRARKQIKILLAKENILNKELIEEVNEILNGEKNGSKKQRHNSVEHK